MAMSRSIGGSSLTTVSPIRICPDVTDSSPATIRKVVVLPQPEGPTRTMNSLSRISRFTSLTACASSNFLLRCLRTTVAIASPFDRSGEAGDVVLDEERVDERHRDRAEQRARHQLAPIEDVAAHQFRGDPDRDRLLLRRGEK